MSAPPARAAIGDAMLAIGEAANDGKYGDIRSGVLILERFNAEGKREVLQVQLGHGDTHHAIVMCEVAKFKLLQMRG